MAPTPTQLAWRGRIEAVLVLVAPALNLLLAAGDRLSRVVERDDPGAAPEPRPVTPMPAQRAMGPGGGAA